MRYVWHPDFPRPDGTFWENRILSDEDRQDLATDGRVVADFSDPATLGCLLALVRDAWEEDFAHVFFAGHFGWMLGAYLSEEPIFTKEDFYTSEAEALVVALEAAQ